MYTKFFVSCVWGSATTISSAMLLFLLLLVSSSLSMKIGVNFAPFTEEEWSVMDFVPLWRVLAFDFRHSY